MVFSFELHPISLSRARIEKQFKSSQREVFRLQKENDSFLEELTKYKQFFTPGQQQRIVTGKRYLWHQEDISMAASLHAAGSKAYKLLYKRGLPLPSVRTLRRHAAMVKVQPGFLEPVLTVLKDVAKSPLGKYCVLSFDEMKVREQYELDKTRKRVLRPCAQALMMMVRGLYDNYQQLIYYNFDKSPTPDLILGVIEKLDAIGLSTVALVCDMATKNISL